MIDNSMRLAWWPTESEAKKALRESKWKRGPDGKWQGPGTAKHSETDAIGLAQIRLALNELPVSDLMSTVMFAKVIQRLINLEGKHT